MTYPRPHSELEVDKNPGLLILVSSVPLQAKGFKIEEGSMGQGPGILTQNYFCVFMCAKRPGESSLAGSCGSCYRLPRKRLWVCMASMAPCPYPQGHALF